MQAVMDYFSGTTVVQVDKGGFPSICRNTPCELQMTELLLEGNLCVNFCGSAGQRVREFVDEFLGCDENQTGSVRYLPE